MALESRPLVRSGCQLVPLANPPPPFTVGCRVGWGRRRPGRERPGSLGVGARSPARRRSVGWGWRRARDVRSLVVAGRSVAAVRVAPNDGGVVGWPTGSGWLSAGGGWWLHRFAAFGAGGPPILGVVGCQRLPVVAGRPTGCGSLASVAGRGSRSLGCLRGPSFCLVATSLAALSSTLRCRPAFLLEQFSSFSFVTPCAFPIRPWSSGVGGNRAEPHSQCHRLLLPALRLSGGFSSPAPLSELGRLAAQAPIAFYE